MKNIKPYSNNNNKKKQIKNMFDNISRTYDLLNTVLSFRMDYFWRKSVIKNLNNNPIFLFYETSYHIDHLFYNKSKYERTLSEFNKILY